MSTTSRRNSQTGMPSRELMIPMRSATSPAPSAQPAMRSPRSSDGEKERGLPDHVQAVPKRTVRHLVAMGVAHRFGERAAGADPAAIRALAPAEDDQRNEHERLHKAKCPARPERVVGEDVLNIERPREDEAEGPPVGAFVPGGAVVAFKQVVGQPAQRLIGLEPPICDPARAESAPVK